MRASGWKRGGCCHWTVTSKPISEHFLFLLLLLDVYPSVYETSCQFCYLINVNLIFMPLLPHSISMNECIHRSWVLTIDDQPSAAASKENFSAHTSHPSRPMWLSCFTYNQMAQTIHNHKHKTSFDKTFKHNKDGILILTRQNHNSYILL